MDWDKLKIDLMKYEGFSQFTYCCPSGKLTIGFGRNLEDIGITRQEAGVLLDNDIRKVTDQARKLFSFFELLNDARQNALLNMLFNMGLTRLLTFKKMIKALESRDYKEAKKQILNSKYARQVKTRAWDIATMMETGEFIE